MRFIYKFSTDSAISHNFFLSFIFDLFLFFSFFFVMEWFFLLGLLSLDSATNRYSGGFLHENSTILEDVAHYRTNRLVKRFEMYQYTSGYFGSRTISPKLIVSHKHKNVHNLIRYRLIIITAARSLYDSTISYERSRLQC